MLQLILGSSSPARKELLARLQLPFTTLSPNIDETALANETPEALVQRLALLKAQAIATQVKEALIIGCDQVGTLAGQPFGKPKSHDDAVAQLLSMSEQTVRFVNGLCLLNTLTSKSQCVLNTYEVTFRPLTLTMIENYLKRETPYQCAGSLKAEGLGIAMIASMKGSDPTSLIGLPLISLTTLLVNEGVSIV